MTALPQDVVTDLRQRIADLEQQLQSGLAERDEAIVQQAATALENARLSAELRAAQDRQTGSGEILRAIANASGDVEQSLHQIAETTARLFDAPSVTLHIAEGDEWGPTIRVGDSSKRIGTEVSAAQLRIGGHNLPGTVLLQDRQIHIPDIDNVDPEFADWPGLPPARAAGTCAIAGTPLRREDKAIGVLIVYRDRPVPFTADELALQQSFADQAVIAIENARLFDEVQARTSDLSEALQQQIATAEVLKVISRSAFDLQKVLDTLAASAARLCEADIVVIHRSIGDSFQGAASFGLPEDHHRAVMDIAHRPGRGSLGARVLLENAPVLIDDAESDPEYTFGSFQRRIGMRSMLGVPLMREGAAIGLLLIFRKRVQPFTKRHVDLATTFADQAVIAIENVRLFDEVQARTEELAASLDELRTAQDRLVQTEKLASLGQLTAGIAHEIKNPLNFVNNFAALSAELIDELTDLLKPAALDGTTRKEADELTQTLKDNLEKVVQHGKRADSIVKNMLLHSREGSGEHRPSDINELLDESLNLAYHGARAEKPQFNITLQRDFDASAGEIELFSQEITRVFLNLIANGFYAVTKRKAELGNSGYEPRLSATTRNLGNTVEIRIRDNGVGIPAEVKEKMFNPFFTTKPAGEGTGLGLSMSHDIIVKQHGGTIDVETEPGQFTEFTIVLPRTSSLHDKKRGQT
jgi:two-component system, NtrC family, sensor kinase